MVDPHAVSRTGTLYSLVVLFAVLGVSQTPAHSAMQNLLQNPGFEEASTGSANVPGWQTRAESAGKPELAESGAHDGAKCLTLPGKTAIEQRLAAAEPGPYLVRCWVKSDSAQPVTLLIENPARPWTGYTYAERRVPKDTWVQLEAFCVLDESGPLALTVGGLSDEFRRYHGTAGDMRAPIRVDDVELVRYERPASTPPTVWDAPGDSLTLEALAGRASWTKATESMEIQGNGAFQDGQLTGTVRKSDGAILLYASTASGLQARGFIRPEPAFHSSNCQMVRDAGRTGIRITEGQGGRSYTAWLDANGILQIAPQQVKEFQIEDCQLRYGLLPSFVGTDICYAPQQLTESPEVELPSTQWFVGLGDGHASMLVVTWPSTHQPVALHLDGQGKDRLIRAMSVGTQDGGFALSYLEHPNLWSEVELKEDWLEDYVPVDWHPPFAARWMTQFFVSPGGRPAFRTPAMQYSFPMAETKTRMWGVWFEDWNHYPAYFDDGRATLHFEKTFVPRGMALTYFLEPAAAEVCSPCEILQQTFGQEKAAALLAYDANGLRHLHYSTPNQFMYDRPVCATTTHLSQIKADEKRTVGVNLATHLYEFIREIRGRVDEYSASFNRLQSYFQDQEQANPQLKPYLAELEVIVREAQSKTAAAYATPLPSVEAKIQAMKALLRDGKGDGFDCGNLDVRGPAGTQDDLCRRFNRLVMRLTQQAALNCGNDPQKAVIAQHVWEESRQVLRHPTRWEPRRTLYFFEP